jgi:predicted permease
MTSLRLALSRLLGLFRSARMERDIDEEIASHLAEATDDLVRQGLSLEDARAAARRGFGGVAQTKEIHRQVRSFAWLDDLARDVRFGARMLGNSRWITLAAIVALAVGIAANTTVFAIVNAILLRDLPFGEPDRIVAIGIQSRGGRSLTTGVSYADLQDWRAASRSFDGLGAMRETTMNVGDDRAAPERVIGSYISADAFRLLDQRPIAGRDFQPDDDRRGAAPVVILGESVWRQRYRADAAVLGQTIRVNGVPSVVIGIMPDAFQFPARSRLWQPLALLPDRTLDRRDVRELSAFGRLKAGVSIEQAASDLHAIATTLERQHPETNRDVGPLVAAYRDRLIGGKVRSTMPVLMGVAAVVLLMACANVANLLLARAAVRSHEVAVRMAIGAGRARIVRQLLAENLLLAGLAGAAGWGLATLVVNAIATALSANEVGPPYWIRFTLDWPVFAFSVAVSVATAVIFGLVPALQTSKPGITNVLLEGGRSTAGGRRSRRWTHALVVFQLVLTPILLTGGGLMMRSIVAQYEMDPGADTRGVMWARLELPEAIYATPEQRARFYRQLDERLARVPGTVASLVSHPPFGGGVGHHLWREDEAGEREARRPRVLAVTIGPRYFETFGKRLVRGSDLGLRGPNDGTPSVVVNEWLAGTVFPGLDPIGRRIRLTSPGNGEATHEWFTIVGIAPDIRQSGTADASGRNGVVYLSYGASPAPRAAIAVRPSVDPSIVAAMLREQVGAVDPDLPLFDVMTVEQLLASADERVGLRVFGSMFIGFAVVALLLSLVGLYAVTAYAAAQRTREIGLRVALGARPAQIWWLVSRRAAMQMGFGLALGMLGAIGIGQLLRGVLVGTRPIDPVTLLAVAAVLAMVGLTASLIPARRALRLDPASVLRTE